MSICITQLPKYSIVFCVPAHPHHQPESAITGSEQFKPPSTQLCTPHPDIATALNNYMAQPPPPHIPPWLLARVQNCVSVPNDVHFESAMYGPIASYLHALFPLDRRFMVKPQGILWPDMSQSEAADGSDEEQHMAISSDDSDDPDYQYEHPRSDDTMASQDSYGVTTESRYVPGSSDSVSYPDFLLVKATETLTDDRLLLIVEVKKRNWPERNARLQLSRYLALAKTKRRVPQLQWLLILGNRTEVYHLESALHDAETVKGNDYNTTGADLRALIHNIAVDNWAI
ncbi:hypothetical protein FPV67DRAFT_1448583 [Lyophyllum atratum]|nr:hypothetical protein FPV67DRAFT_1448583 [Lyophyllum atratum]